MPSVVSSFYEFGEFRVDTQNRVLWREQEPVPLTPKAFEVLLALVQHSGQLITKDDLMKMVWPDSFVEESNLTQTVFVLLPHLYGTPRMLPARLTGPRMEFQPWCRGRRNLPERPRVFRAASGW
jgi:hypothetical protein